MTTTRKDTLLIKLADELEERNKRKRMLQAGAVTVLAAGAGGGLGYLAARGLRNIKSFKKLHPITRNLIGLGIPSAAGIGALYVANKRNKELKKFVAGKSA